MAMALVGVVNGDSGRGGGVGTHVVQVNDSEVADEICPLLVDVGDKPNRINIFSVSYTGKRPHKETTLIMVDAEASFFSQIFMWVWSGSKFSGLLCMVLSSTIYYIMEALMDIFPARTIPIYESIFTRCTIIMILSLLWLRKTGHPLFVPKHARNLLILRSLSGLISLLSFIYSVRNLPLSYAISLNFATPIVASIGAKFILHEKLAFSAIMGISISYIGVLIIFQPKVLSPETRAEPDDLNNRALVTGQIIFAILLGLLSSVANGFCYCLIKAAAKASDHPVYTVFSFGLLVTPLSAICMLIFQNFVLPNIFTFLFMVVLGALAFLAEVYLARGLQLEKVCKATNMLYIQVIFSLAWSMSYLGNSASFNKLIGCLLIVVSLCITLYIGPEREQNDGS